MKYLLLAPLFILACACTQTAVLGDGNGGGGGFDLGPSSGGGGADGGAPQAGNGAGNGGAASDPMALGAEVCAARAACETVQPSCAHDNGCIFTFFREELYEPLTTCLSNCGSFEACWQAAVAGATPPNEFALYVSLCNQSVVTCETEPVNMGNDWCEYDMFSAESYSAMIQCFDISCANINDCLRSIVFASEPSCFDF
jgi:hypothetical protein